MAGLVSTERLEPGLLALYLPCTLAALALLFLLAWRLFDRRSTALIALVLYLAGTRLVPIGSPSLHSAEMTPQVLALPLELGAVYLLLVGRELPAGLRGKMWIGPGSAKRCNGCGESVARGEQEFELEVADALTFRFHAECYHAWATFSGATATTRNAPQS